MTEPTTGTDSTRSWQPYRRSSPLLDVLGGLEKGPDGAVRMTVQNQHCNDRGQRHGGIISAYADFIIGHHLEVLTDSSPPTSRSTSWAQPSLATRPPGWSNHSASVAAPPSDGSLSKSKTA